MDFSIKENLYREVLLTATGNSPRHLFKLRTWVPAEQEVGGQT